MRKEVDLERILKKSILAVSFSIFLLLFFPFISTIAKQDAAETYSQYSEFQNPSINNKLTGEVILNASQSKEPKLAALITITSIALAIIIISAIFIKIRYRKLHF